MPIGIYNHPPQCGFQKGHKSIKYWKDKNFSEKHRKNLSRALKGNKNRLDTHPSRKTRKKLSEALKGEKCYIWGKHPSKETLKRMSEAHKGNKRALGSKRTEKMRKKMSKVMMGKKNHRWKGGITLTNQKIRQGIEFRLWREAVYAIDNWTCQKCGVKGGILHPHHIYNFSKYLELRFAIDNGITLCKKCHKEFHKRYSYNNNNQKQIDEFINLVL